MQQVRAAFINNHGRVDDIHVGELPDPVLQPGEILVETRFAALNHLDAFVVQGWPGLSLSMPHVLGADGAGIVRETGPGVAGIEPGDVVAINPGVSCGTCDRCLSGHQNLCPSFGIMGEHRWGTFATRFTVPAVNAVKVPAGFSIQHAAAAPLTFLTAWRALVTRGGVSHGDVVFIHGAGGGVSTAAIQIAKLLGATVITTTSTPEKERLARVLGADHVINYKATPDYGTVVYKDMTAKRGVDVVLDSVGASTFQQSIRMLRPDGVLVVPGATSGPRVDLDLRHVFWKQLRIVGTTMASQQEFRDVMRLVFAGKLVPVIDSVFPLDSAREAEQHLVSGGQFGKVLLSVP